MKTASRYILCLICTIFPTFCLYGQDSSGLDAELNLYELACSRCMDLKNRVGMGEHVSRNEASALIGRFLNMNSGLKSSYDIMNPGQRLRFDAINKWFASGVRPPVMDHIPLPSVSRVSQSSLDIPYCSSLSCRRIIEEKTPIRTYILATASLPQSSYGAMLGLQKGRWGGFVRFKSNFSSGTEASYNCTGNGTIDGDYSFWPGEGKKKQVLMASGGLLYGIKPWLNIYGGLGYGYQELFWEDIDGKWAKVQDYSYKGIAAEAGVIASWKSLCIGAGISTTAFRTASADLSIGVRF